MRFVSLFAVYCSPRQPPHPAPARSRRAGAHTHTHTHIQTHTHTHTHVTHTHTRMHTPGARSAKKALFVAGMWPRGALSLPWHWSARRPPLALARVRCVPVVVSSSFSSFTDRQACLCKKCQVNINVSITALHAAARSTRKSQECKGHAVCRKPRVALAWPRPGRPSSALERSQGSLGTHPAVRAKLTDSPRSLR